MSKGKITFIGLGLHDEKDITLKAIDEIKKCDKTYAEFYTSKLTGTNINKIEKTIGKNIEVLSREQTEKGDKILNEVSKGKKIAFLTCGDPMTATTHIDLRIRAEKRDIETEIIHGNSIITAAPGLLGLQNYKFGRSTTIVYPEKGYFPTSPYNTIKNNRKAGLHTLVLLDIKADEEKYMTANEGIELLLKMEKKQNENVFKDNNVMCVIAKAGSRKPKVFTDRASKLMGKDFGPPLHVIIIPGKLHFMEIEALERFAQLPKQLSEKLQKL